MIRGLVLTRAIKCRPCAALSSENPSSIAPAMPELN